MVKTFVFLFLFPLFVFCAARPVTNDARVTIREYDVPTPNSRPHDTAVAPNNSLWYTGQLANKLGRLDPKTGDIKEYPLKTPGSGPHGLAADKDGNIWFTANFKAYIGKLDPRTGNVTEYPMPDPRARDPHSLAFNREGLIFFTTQDSNFVGRLDPRTGKIEFGSNKIGKINPKTLNEKRSTLLSASFRKQKD